MREAHNSKLKTPLQRSSEDVCAEHVIADDAGDVANESYPCDLLHIPSEGDLLQDRKSVV